MPKPSKICRDVYQIGGSGLSDPYDCAVYIIDAGDLVLIDSGAGTSFKKLVANITNSGLDPKKLKAILVTHAHIDHIGALRQFRDEFGLKVIAHELDADNIERGTRVGAEAYGIDYTPCPIDMRIKGNEESLAFGKYELKVIHIPGHTPGSIAAYIETSDGRVLFGQDIHGPYLPEWGADRAKAKESLQKLIDLKADILCEGHFGIYKPAAAVEKYIRGYVNSL